MNRIQEIRTNLGMSRAELARLIGCAESQIVKLERGERRLTTDWMERIGRALGVPAHELMTVKASELSARSPKKPAHQAQDARKPSTFIDELDVRAGAGFASEADTIVITDAHGHAQNGHSVLGQWSLPDDYLQSVLRVKAGRTRIIEVQGDSMEPTLYSGDRIMVNVDDRVPSPPGIFALWDGMAVVVKRVEHVLGSDPPAIIITSDNARHQSYQMTADEVNIIGRVVWVARRL